MASLPFVVCAVLILIGVLLHELGHALAYRSKGIPVEQVGLGFGPSLKFGPFRWCPGVTFSLGPILIGAFVSVSTEYLKKVSRLKYRDRALISGAGIMMNFLYCSLLLVIGHVLFPGQYGVWSTWGVVIFGTIAAGMILFRYTFCLYIIPFMGFLMLYLLGRVFLASPASLIGNGYISDLSDGYRAVSMYSQSFRYAFELTFVLGIVNSLPMIPLDGGHIMLVWIDRLFGKGMIITAIKSMLVIGGALIVLALIVAPLFKDMSKLFGW